MTSSRRVRTAAYGLTWGYLAGLSRAAFLYGTDHDQILPLVPLMSFLVQDGDRLVLFDTGASAEWAERRGVVNYVDPATLVIELGHAPDSVQVVVLSHLHWDHATNIERFPHAEFVLQRRELDGWRRAFTWGSDFAWVYENRVDPAQLAHLLTSSRTKTVAGDTAITRRIRCHLTPGHTFGTQCLSVQTPSGPLLLASDTVFLSENVERMIPLGNGLEQIAMLKSFVKVRRLAAGGAIVPGHDPAVHARFRSLGERILELAVPE